MRNAIAKKSMIVENGQPVGVSFEFSDGKTMKVHCEDLPDNVLNLAMCHGLSQKIGDSYSGASGPGEARQRANTTIQSLIDGDWNVRADVITDLAEAMHRITQKPIDACRDKLAKMSKDDRAALSKHKQVKVMLQRIKLERAEASVSDDDDLSDF